jgi:hypothetical protein
VISYFKDHTIKPEERLIVSILIVLPLFYFIYVTVLTNQTLGAAPLGPDYSSLNIFDNRKLDKFFDDEFNGNLRDKGRVFYSHSMMIYGSDDEKSDKELIRLAFSEFGIVSPKFYEGKDKKMQGDMNSIVEMKRGENVEEMEFYKKVVSSCQMLVYSKWNKEIPSGVAIEVNHAIDIGIPVFELVGNEFKPQKFHVNGLDYQQTVKLYRAMYS